MATANWQTDQPTNLNYLSPVNFDLQVNKLPKTKYFCTGVTLPGVIFSEALHSLPLAINSYLTFKSFFLLIQPFHKVSNGWSIVSDLYGVIMMY